MISSLDGIDVASGRPHPRLIALLVIGVVLSSISVRATPKPPQAETTAARQAFVRWAEGVARSENASIDHFYAGHFADDSTPLLAVDFCSDDGLSRVWLVEQNPERRWRIEGGDSPSCDGGANGGRPGGTAPVRNWRELPATIPFDEGGPHADFIQEVELVAGRWSVVSSFDQDHDAQGGAVQSEDWRALSFTSHTVSLDRDTEPRKYDFKGALFVALSPTSPESARLPPTENDVIFGTPSWRGVDDASLNVRAVHESPDVVRLDVDVTDDVRVPVPAGASGRAFILADHLELWWGQIAAGCPSSQPTCDVRQLGVGTRADGSIDARWLYPGAVPEPPPRCETTKGGYRIWLSLKRLTGARDSRADARLPLTVAYSDADTRGGPQKSIVATSTLRRADVDSFGTLGVFAGGARFPSLSASEVEIEVSSYPDGWVPPRRP